MIHKNLTPFFWGPKVTARRLRQIEMAVVVRGTFRLVPGPPVVQAIEDKIDQGFMTGDVFPVDDLDRTGPLEYASDFVDWKMFAEALLKGTCYPPNGADVVSEATFAIGDDWSKTLRVLGPRTYKPGLLLSGSCSDPEPFTHMPLTWQNAYGGEGYSLNPAGKGYDTPELPNVEYPRATVSRTGQKRVQPASFGPISPNWAPRNQMLGKKWGKKWERDRKPFYAEDFDWRYFQAAPEDQQMEEFFNGDEELTFTNLHPKERVWSTRLPGLRIRALVRDGDDKIHDVNMFLDTIYADLDANRLYLTWRGHCPVKQLDMTDVQSTLIASEPLEQAPKPVSYYQGLLEAFEDDPIGLKDAFPPGFMEFAAAVEAAEAAQRDGTPMPDLKAAADALPVGCPFPPWFLLAVGGADDPLGVMSKIPPALLDEEDPLHLKAKIGQAADVDSAKLNQAAGGMQGATVKELPDGLEKVADELPDEQAKQMRELAQDLRKKLAETDAVMAKDPKLAGALSKPGPTRAPVVPSLAEQMRQIKVDALAKLELPPEVPLTPEKATQLAASKQTIAAMPSLDDMIGNALSGLNDIKVPQPPAPVEIEGFLGKMTDKLNVQQARYEARGYGANAMMGLFALGHRIINKAPRPKDIPGPDMSPLRDGLLKAKDQLLGMGVAAATLAPLNKLTGDLEAVMAQIPQVEKPPEEDFAYQDLRNQDFSGQDLSGKSFARADLSGANLSGANLTGADLRESRLQKANFTQANLTQANLDKADAQKANFTQANLWEASLRGTQLGKADLTTVQLGKANLEGADLQKAVLPGSALEGANLTDAWIQDADMRACKLRGARMEQVKGQKTKLAGSDMRQIDGRFADFSKSDLSQCDLSGADLSIAQLQAVRADGANFNDVKWDMAQMQKSRFVGATFLRSQSSMGGMQKCNLTQADMRGVTFDKVDMTGAVLHEADFSGSKLKQVMFRDTQATKARFVKTDLFLSHATGKAVFRECNFVGAIANRTKWLECELIKNDFSHAQLRDAVFQFATIEEVNFYAALLKGAIFRKAKITRSRFVNADLNKADMSETLMLDNQFTSANCYDAKFILAQIASCDWLETNLTFTNFDQAEGGPK